MYLICEYVLPVIALILNTLALPLKVFNTTAIDEPVSATVGLVPRLLNSLDKQYSRIQTFE